MRNPEKRWVFWFALVVMAVTSLPYLLGYTIQGENWRFSGFVFGIEDGNSYIAKMLSGSTGSWLFRSPFTAYPQWGVLAFTPYLLLGKLAGGPGLHEQLVALFHLFRIVAGVVAILATYDFLAVFIRDWTAKRIGLAAITLGGGLGWIAVFAGQHQWLGSLPLEFYSPETFGFLELYGLPHLSVARAALLWSLVAYLRAGDRLPESARRDGLRIGGFWLLAALFQPLTALVIGWVLAIHLLFLGGWQFWQSARGRTALWPAWWRRLRLVMWAALLPAPLLVYTTLTFSLDPFLKTWTAQNLILSPHPLHYLLAYGLLLPLVFLGGVYILRDTPSQGGLLVVWVASLPLLAYAPLNIQRRLPEGVWVAIVTLALVAQTQIVKRSLRWITRYMWLLIFPSTVFLLVGGFSTASRVIEPAFRSRPEVRAFEYLAANSIPGTVVLAGYQTSNALPAWAPLRVVIGHGPESANLSALLPRVESFFQVPTSDLERQALLQELSVDYVFWGPVEVRIGDWDPGQAPYLRLLFAEQGYSIFGVNLDAQ